MVAVAAGGANMTETIRKQFERHLRQGRFFARDDLVVVAVSTGVDSMALLDLLQGLPDDLQPRLLVAHVNHELRSQSVDEEAYLRRYCRQHDLPLMVAHWKTADHPVHGVENAARQFRYAFFKQVMRQYGATTVVTAHHANDLAETMLMKLTRGGQLDQLVGIHDQRPLGTGKLVRPLLNFTKNELYQYARQRGLKWYEDQTNHELTVSRNRYRHQIIPALERENPRLIEHLLAYRTQLTGLLNWRAQELTHLLGTIQDGDHLRLASLLHLPRFQQEAVLRHWMETAGVTDLKAGMVTQLCQALANPQKPQDRINLPGDWVLVKDYRTCWLENINKLPDQWQNEAAYMVKLGQQYPIDDRRRLIVASPSDQLTAIDWDQVMTMWLDPQRLPLTLRPWQPGDHLRLKGGGHQLVRRVLIDQKVPTAARDRQLVLVDATGTVVWLVDRKWSWFDRPTDYRQRWQQLLIGIINKEEHKRYE